MIYTTQTRHTFCVKYVYNYKKDSKMKKSNITALLLGAALFTTLGVANISASSKCGGESKSAMKCAAGKCGSSMKKQSSKCGGEKKSSMKCGASMEKPTSKCGSKKKATMKCASGKCGSK
jgi:hypothetical protein